MWLLNQTEWSNAHVSAPSTTILPTTVSTFHSLNDFGHVIYTLYTSMYQNIAKLLTLVLLCANGPGEQGSIPGQVIPKTQKMVLDASLLNSAFKRYRSRVKWSNPGKGVAPSSTPWCSSYRKGSLLFALDYSHQLYLWLT